MGDCLYCDRRCSVCDYDVDGGWEHVQQPQPPGSNATVCNLKPVVRPLTEILPLYLDHVKHARPHLVPTAGDS